MRILDKAVYVGPSLYAHFPVIRLDIDLGELEQWPSGKLGRGVHRRADRGAAGTARARLLLRQAGRVHPPADRGRGHLDGPHPRARRHRAAERGRRARDLRQDPLRRRDGSLPRDLPVRAGRRRASRRDGSASRSCTRCCRASCGRRARSRPTSTSPPSGTSSSASRSGAHLGPSTMSLVRAAEERKIPWIRLNEQSLIQFGHGRYQQRIQATVTSRTSHIAVELASDKEETNRILGNLGLPVPQQRLVQSEDDARRGGGADRLPGGGQAVQRQPRPRHLDPPHHRGAGARGLRGGARAQPERDRRELHQRRGPPHAGDRRAS